MRPNSVVGLSNSRGIFAGWAFQSLPVSFDAEKFHLHFQDDGTLIVRRAKDAVEKHFPSLSEALAFVYALNGSHEVRLKVYDSKGREVIGKVS